MKIRLVAALLALSAGIAWAQPPEGIPEDRGRALWKLSTPKDYLGSVQSAVVDPESRDVYLATRANLYRVRDGRAVVAAEPPRSGARLLLAPGGGLYAWLTHEPGWQGLFSARLMAISGEELAELRLPEHPYGFGALYLGFRGGLVLTVSPLDDWQGLEGRFLYVFWSREGEMLGDFVMKEHRQAVLDPVGKSVVLLGANEATAFSASGEKLWSVEGRFRKAALSAGAEVALLNFAEREAIDLVAVVEGGQVTGRVRIPTPVHRLVLAPDASVGVIVGDMGRFFYFQPPEREPEEAKRLPFEGAFTITDVQLVDREVLALGVLHRVGKPPRHRWPRGSVLVVRKDGEMPFLKTFDIREPIAFNPAVDAHFGGRLFFGFTQDAAILVDAEP